MVSDTESLISNFDTTSQADNNNEDAKIQITDNSNGKTGEETIAKKSLGLFTGIGVILNIMVGSGIFVSPNGVLKYTGSVGLSLIIWVIGGSLALCGAMCYAELGTMISISGGDYSYIKKAFGNLPAFLYLWAASTVFMPVGNAAIAVTFADYLIKPFFSVPPNFVVPIVACGLICIVTFINCMSVKIATKAMDILSAGKILVMLSISGAGIYNLCCGKFENFENAFEGSIWKPASISIALYQGLFSFSGFNYLNLVVEDLVNPKKNLPRAIWLAIPLVMIIYIFINVSYFTVLTPAEFMNSDAVAVSFADKTLGSYAESLGWIIPLFVVCCTVGSSFGGIFTAPRPPFFPIIDAR